MRIARPARARRAWTLALSLALSLSAAARAGDTTPPVITHVPAHAFSGQPVHVTAHIVDESRIFPQLFFRYGSSGPYEPPLDLKKAKGAKDDYEATIPFKSGSVEYYVECYDEFGNGPARAGAPDGPLHVIVDEPAAPATRGDLPLPAPGSSAPASDPGTSFSATPIAAAPASPPPAPPARSLEQRPQVSLRLAPPAPPLSASQAAWRSLVVPGWGQVRTERPLRGALFGVATGASLFATLWYTVRAHQANTIYVNAPLSVRSQAYDQAVDYADARNTLLGVTIGLWAANVAEAYFLHGTKDPW